ncbi:MAG: type III-A CRISPR-associated protein Csm2 [Planctomycetaceae bacterium]|nr:type III-A CRISPR-associated protein Csm2 [Planctomycetaceae bacterium]
MSQPYRSGGSRGGGPPHGGSRPGGPPTPRPANPANSLFDVTKPDAELYDDLAEKQADVFVSDKIASSQLRRFFSEIKDLYRRFNSLTKANSTGDDEAIYKSHIEPQFRMMRSKIAYTVGRASNVKVPYAFADFLSLGISKVRSAKDFRRFVLHFEAVVGFMYGKDALSK